MGAELIVPSTGGSAPSGTGIVRATGGAFVDPAAPLGATDIPAKPQLVASLANSQSATSAVATLAYNTPSVNTAGFTYSSGVWTATIAGDYLIEAVICNSGSAVVGAITPSKNGSIVDVGSFVQLNYRPNFRGIITLAVGETFSMGGYAPSTVALDTSPAQNCFLRATRLT